MHRPDPARLRAENPKAAAAAAATTPIRRPRAIALLAALTLATSSFVALGSTAARADDATPPTTQPGDSTPVTIADPALASCVQTALGTDTYTAADLAGISSLTCSGVADASALAGFTGLTSLNLDDGTISDVTPLAGLTGLQTLSLADNHIADLSSLATLAAAGTAIGAGQQTITLSPQVVESQVNVPRILNTNGTSEELVAGHGVTVEDGRYVGLTSLDGGAVTWGDKSTTSGFSGTISFASIPNELEFDGPSNLQGTLGVGSTVTAVPTTWDDGTTLSYQWIKDGNVIGTASTYAIQPADDGDLITLVTTASRDGFDPVSKITTPFTVRDGLFPWPSPIVTGVPTVFQQLTANVGGAFPSDVTATYQWYRNNVAIAGATSLNYVLQIADAGTIVSFRETATRPYYNTLEAGTRPVAVSLNTFDWTTGPSISGPSVITKTVTAKWDDPVLVGATISYQWTASGVPIPGATASNYTLPPSSAGKSIGVNITASRPGYVTLQAHAQPVTSIAYHFTAVPTPTIAGSPHVGNILTAKTGTWAPGGISFTYQWFRNGTAIAGATRPTYVVTSADVKQRITVTDTGSKTTYASVTRTSPALTGLSGTIAQAPTPTLTGSSSLGHVLSANLGTWSAGVAVHIQWRHNGANIAGATGRSYGVAPTDVGQTISVVVTGTRSGYTSVAKASAGKAVPVTTYKNCTALHTVYPHGVARAGVTYDLRSGTHQAVFAGTYFNTALYNANAKSDADKDGIACEKK